MRISGYFEMRMSGYLDANTHLTTEILVREYLGFIANEFLISLDSMAVACIWKSVIILF